MSIFYCLVLIAIAWALSAFTIGLLHVWHLFSVLPLWLTGLLLASAIALFVSEP